MQLTIFATKGNSMSKQQKFFSITPIAAGVLAVTATTFSISAQAELQFYREAKGPVTVTNGTYSFFIQQRIINDDPEPKTGTYTPIEVQIEDAIKQSFPDAIRGTVVVSDLQIVAEDVLDTVASTKTKPVYFTTLNLDVNDDDFAGTGATATKIFETKQEMGAHSAVTVSYKVSFKPGAETGPFRSTSTLTPGGKTGEALFVIPAKPGQRQSACPTGTVPSNINLVKNGDFSTLHGDSDKKLAPGQLIAGSFTSDYSYVGDNSYANYNEISVADKLYASDINYVQYPFPGAVKNGDVPAVAAAKGFIVGAGGSATGKKIWKQTVSGLDVNANYQLEAWASNAAPAGAGTPDISEPNIGIQAGSYIEKKKLPIETSTDDWHQLKVLVTPASASMDLSVANFNATTGGDYNLFAVTGIALRKCVAPDDVDKVDTGSGSSGGTGGSDDNTGGSNTGGGTGTDTGTGGSTGGTDSSGNDAPATSSGGGGGALGFALAGMGLIGLRRRRF